MRRATAIALVLVAASAAVAAGLLRRGRDDGARCGPGFAAHGARCLPAQTCPAPLVASPHGCDAPDVRVLVLGAEVAVGPSDWEAEGRVAPRVIRVQAFRVDAFEVTRGKFGEFAGPVDGDVARAASGMTRGEAEAFCALRGGRLPSEDEWMVAAASALSPPPRYPWGDTGAVCRRGAWGLENGPCASGADGPDTVGTHPDGDSPLGLHDLAGNVAEWVATATSTSTPTAIAIAKGGSWKSSLVTDLRIWARLELRADARDPRVGLRCAYPP